MHSCNRGGGLWMLCYVPRTYWTGQFSPLNLATWQFINFSSIFKVCYRTYQIILNDMYFAFFFKPSSPFSKKLSDFCFITLDNFFFSKNISVFSKIKSCTWKFLYSFPGLLALVTCYKWHLTGDLWQVTCDRWHMTCDMWHVIHDTRQLTHDT